MASKTGKLILSGAVTMALAAGCQTQPLSTSPSLGLDRASTESYGLLAKGGKTAQQGAGAQAAPSCLEQPYAVFARSADVNFHLTGARNVIEGDVHTNDLLKMAGNNDHITGVAEAVDGYSIKGNNNTTGSAPGGAIEGYPLTIDPDALGAPTFSFDGDVNLNERPEVWASKGVLKPGIYRATGTITLPTNGVSGTVTFVAARIQLPGKSHDLKAYAGGVLGYASAAGANAIHLAGNSNTYQGLFAAPNGEFQLTGHQNDLSGMVMADTFKLAGSNNTIRFADHGYCPPSATTTPEGGSTAPTPTPAGDPEPTPTPDGEPIPTPTPTASPLATPTPEGEPTTSPEPSSSPSPEPTPTPETSEPTPTPTPDMTPGPIVER